MGWERQGISGRTKKDLEGRLPGGRRKLECVIDKFILLIVVIISWCYTSQNFATLQVRKVCLDIRFKTGNIRLSYKELLLVHFCPTKMVVSCLT